MKVVWIWTKLDGPWPARPISMLGRDYDETIEQVMSGFRVMHPKEKPWLWVRFEFDNDQKVTVRPRHGN